MPQLDQFTYLTQFMWLCFFYMTFYILLLNDGLPKISRILKLRSHLCATSAADESAGDSELNDSATKSLNENQSLSSETQDVIFRTLNTSISYLNSSIHGAFQWCLKSVESFNNNQLKPMNKTYLCSIGEISLSENMKNNALEASAPLAFSSRSSISLEISQIWALRVQKCCLSNTVKKKKRK